MGWDTCPTRQECTSEACAGMCVCVCDENLLSFSRALFFSFLVWLSTADYTHTRTLTVSLGQNTLKCAQSHIERASESSWKRFVRSPSWNWETETSCIIVTQAFKTDWMCVYVCVCVHCACLCLWVYGDTEFASQEVASTYRMTESISADDSVFIHVCSLFICRLFFFFFPKSIHNAQRWASGYMILGPCGGQMSKVSLTFNPMFCNVCFSLDVHLLGVWGDNTLQ